MQRMTAEQYRQESAEPKQNKFRNKRTKVDGITFDSAAEARRWGSLQMLQKAGRIDRLERQPKFELHGQNGTKVGEYTADFRYLELGAGGLALAHVVEDVKSEITARQTDYKLRVKLFQDNYPAYDFREVKGS